MDVLIAIAMTLLVRDYSPIFRVYVDENRFPQLRRMRGNEGRFSNYVLPRVVRLIIETNTLTGAPSLE